VAAPSGTARARGALAACVALLGGCVGAASPAVTSPGGSAALPTVAVGGPTTAPPRAAPPGRVARSIAAAVVTARDAPPPATPVPRPTATVTPTAPATRPALPLRRHAGGQPHDLHLAVGQQFLVDLGSTVDWTVTIADQGIVRRVPGVLVIRGAQGSTRRSRPARPP